MASYSNVRDLYSELDMSLCPAKWGAGFLWLHFTFCSLCVETRVSCSTHCHGFVFCPHPVSCLLIALLSLLFAVAGRIFLPFLHPCLKDIYPAYNTYPAHLFGISYALRDCISFPYLNNYDSWPNMTSTLLASLLSGLSHFLSKRMKIITRSFRFIVSMYIGP